VTFVSLQDGTGGAHGFSAYGASLALLTGDDSEIGLAVARYDELSPDDCVRELTFVALDSYFYPVGAGGFAPFAVTQVGLGNLKESDPRFGCGLLPNVVTSTEFGLAYGLGLRVGVGDHAVALIEGRFFQVPNSAIQALEARAQIAVAFGRPRSGQFLAGTLGPVVGYLIPLGGPLHARAPLAGVRFRRDTKRGGTIGLQIDYAALEITQGCSTRCDPVAIFFAPGYEASLHPSWGRLYGTLGALLAGFPAEGPDRGIAQGLQGGVGADVWAGARVMWNVNARLAWLQRSSGENVFAVQLGIGISPRLVHPKAGASELGR
jgi:hypothetical protein